MSGRYSSLTEVLARIEQARTSLAAVLIHLNDTYLIDERKEQSLPGFPRVTTTVKTIRKHVRRILGADRTLVLHSGDFLAPSRVGKADKGKAMVKLLNGMGVDYCTLGNHEFDYKDATLRERLGEAKFKVLLANVRCPGVNLMREATWPAGDKPLIALTGVVSRSVYESFDNKKAWKYRPEFKAVRKFVHRSRKTPFRVILTHAKWSEDRALRQYMPRRTYFLGGHDHDIEYKTDDGPLLLKNLSNFRTIRIVLLLAGGEGTADPLHHAVRRWNARMPAATKRSSTRFADFAGSYRDALRTVTRGLHPVDAAVIQKRLAVPPKLPADPDELAFSMASSGSSAQYQVLHDALDNGPMVILQQPDEELLEMDYHGHGAPNPAALRLVQKVLPNDPAEDKVVVDFRKSCPGKLDASDEHLRNGPTNFSLLVTECVRREGGADFALLNSGSFRCDAELPARLRLRDLRDTFLYDDPRAVVVLDLPATVIDKALEHGRKQAGNGAFPQTSPLTLPSNTQKVAIAAFLVEKIGKGDGYDKVIGDALGISRAKLWKWSAKASKAFSIEDAVVKWAKTVGYQPVPVSKAAVDALAEFLNIVDAMYKDGLVHTNSLEWRADMGTDASLNDPNLEKYRNDLREWIRAIPEVAEWVGLIPVLKNKSAGKWETAFEEEVASKTEAAYNAMVKKRTEISSCPRTFETRRSYDYVFDAVAVGIGGWQR